MTCYLNYTRIKQFVNQFLRFLPVYLYSVPIVVSSANMSAQVLVSKRVDHLHETGRELTQGRTDPWGTPEITSFLSEIAPA